MCVRWIVFLDDIRYILVLFSKRRWQLITSIIRLVMHRYICHQDEVVGIEEANLRYGHDQRDGGWRVFRHVNRRDSALWTRLESARLVWHIFRFTESLGESHRESNNNNNNNSYFWANTFFTRLFSYIQDRNMFETSNAERICTRPVGLQTMIDAIVSKYPMGRSFVR